MSFSDDVKRLTREYERRMDAVFRKSAEETVNDAQTPTGQGGRMRVDTNFLRASGGAALNQMPSGPTENAGGKGVSGRVTGAGLTETLGRWRPGDTFNWGWTAVYARRREAKDGFMRGAADRWTERVENNVRRGRS